MGTYGYISIIAMVCYGFMLLMFLTAKRNKIVNSFLVVLVGLLFWAGGSAFMRVHLWPSYEFWYQVSLLGILLLPYACLLYTSGGGTAMIGDPSGRTDMRQMMTPETIQHNCDCFKKQMSRFIDFSDGKALMVNNADWLMDLNYVEVLREVGAHFSVNRMLTAECYKQRMEKGLSFLEFNYMICLLYTSRCV